MEKVPGFSVVLPLVLFVAGEDSDGILVRRHRGRNDIPNIFRNAVDSQVIEIGFLVTAPGPSVGVAQIGYEVSRLQVAGLRGCGFDLDADEVSAQIEDHVVLCAVADRSGHLEAELDGLGHKSKLGPLASLFVVADVHAGSFHWVPCGPK